MIAPTPQPMRRADCHVCGRSTPVRRDGELREHWSTPTRGPKPCPGSGQQAQVAAPAGEMSTAAEPQAQAAVELSVDEVCRAVIARIDAWTGATPLEVERVQRWASKDLGVEIPADLWVRAVLHGDRSLRRWAFRGHTSPVDGQLVGDLWPLSGPTPAAGALAEPSPELESAETSTPVEGQVEREEPDPPELWRGLVPIDEIVLDERSQTRIGCTRVIIEEYAELYRSGAMLPPVVLFREVTEGGVRYWLADGWHRVHAARLAERPKVDAEIRDGTLRDAIRYGLGANAAHGLRRSNGDKRRAVTIALGDEEWSRLSDRELARICGVSHTFVANVRRELEPDPRPEGGNGCHPDPAPTAETSPAAEQARGETSREARERRQRGEPPPGFARLGEPPATAETSIDELVEDGDDEDLEIEDIEIEAPRCRVCGCTDEDCSQCVEATGHPCWWVDDPEGYDLCSRCALEQQVAREASRATAEPDPDPALDAALREVAEDAEDAAAELVRDVGPVLEDAETELVDPPAELGDLAGDVALESAVAAELPDDERAPFDAYYTPRRVARACVRWLCQTFKLRQVIDIVDPAVGGGAWADAWREERPKSAVDRCDIDPEAPGLRGAVADELAVCIDWLAEVAPDNSAWEQQIETGWDVCASNRPYKGSLRAWVERSLERAPLVAYLERETITGTVDRARWLKHECRPAWIVKVAPRPKWEGPGARETSDFGDSVLIVWVHGHEGPTLFDWIIVDDEAPESGA